VLALNFDPKDSKLIEMKQGLIAFGIAESDFDKAWMSIKKVWASKFNERAFLAVKKIGVRLDQVYMAVLIQKIVRAKYAFVVHTTNPTNGEESEIYVEACRGLGESLVSDMPGQALSFTVVKSDVKKTADDGRKQCTVNSYPNKPIELITGHGFMFRSDSNSEDLPGFAGAGLFDSYAIEDETIRRVSYSDD
jgi:alpha-glucan,water dikinase